MCGENRKDDNSYFLLMIAFFEVQVRWTYLSLLALHNGLSYKNTIILLVVTFLRCKSDGRVSVYWRYTINIHNYFVSGHIFEVRVRRTYLSLLALHNGLSYKNTIILLVVTFLRCKSDGRVSVNWRYTINIPNYFVSGHIFEVRVRWTYLSLLALHNGLSYKNTIILLVVTFLRCKSDGRVSVNWRYTINIPNYFVSGHIFEVQVRRTYLSLLALHNGLSYKNTIILLVVTFLRCKSDGRVSVNWRYTINIPNYFVSGHIFEVQVRRTYLSLLALHNGLSYKNTIILLVVTFLRCKSDGRVSVNWRYTINIPNYFVSGHIFEV